MVNAIVLGTLLALVAQAPAPAPAPASGDPVRSVAEALGKTAPIWFDPAKDSVKPVNIPIERASEGTGTWGLRGFGLGNILPITALAVALIALLVVLVWYWQQYRPDPAELESAVVRTPGRARSTGQLPEALRGADDPWSEAIRLRDQGELGAAVVRLFAHQLLTLSRLGLVRLAPGRTGRQLVRSVSDAEFRRLATPTLRWFETVYYGHHAPTPAEFAALWTNAEAFERLAAGAGVTA